MKLSFMKAMTPLFILALAVFSATSASAETMVINPHLYFNLTSEDIFVKQTADNDTIAYINFQVHFDAGYVPCSGDPECNMQEINARFKYDSDEITLIENLCTINYAEWDGYGGCPGLSPVEETSPDDTGAVTVTIYIKEGDNTGKTTPTTYVTLAFTAICQEETNDNPLVFTTVYLDNKVLLANYDDCEPGTTYDGEVGINNYDATLTIFNNANYDTTLHCNPYGSDLKVPVYGNTNYFPKYFKHTISFDNEKLDFDSVTYIASPSYNAGYSQYQENANHDGVEVQILYTDGALRHELDDEVIYYLWYTVLTDDDEGWLGSADKATLDFDEENCLGYVWYICNDLTEDWAYENGDVILDFKADMRVYVDEVLMNTSDAVNTTIQLSSDWDVGKGQFHIATNLCYDEYLDQQSVTEDDVDFQFTTDSDPGAGCDGSAVLMAYQDDNSIITGSCDTPDWNDLLYCPVKLSGSYNAPATYANRQPLELNLLASYENGYFYPLNTSTVIDTLDIETLTSGNGLTLTNGEVKVGLAEFSLSQGSSNNVFVEQELRIRNNFDLESFEVTVDLGRSFWCIVCIVPEDDIEVTEITEGSEYTISSEVGFDGILANGDSYTTVATVYLGVPDECIGNGSYNVTPDLNDGSAEDASSNDAFHIYYVENTATGYCIDSDGGCDLSPYALPECNTQGQGSKNSADLDNSLLPTNFALHANRPNPFNPQTVIEYDVPVATHVTIEIINILGQSIMTLVDETKAPGRHEAVWNGTDANGVKVASGIYLYNMRAGDYVETRKMMLMK